MFIYEYILGTAPSFWSRISNQELLHRMFAPKLSTMKQVKQQLVFLGALATRPDTCPLVRCEILFSIDMRYEV